MLLYYIHTKSICSPEESWLENIIEKHACTLCKRLYPELRKNSIDVWVEEQPDISAVNSVHPPRIGIARRDFLHLFTEEVKQYLKLGEVFDRNGLLIERFATFVSEKHMILRGSEKSRLRICEKCGGYIYTSIYPWYVIKESVFNRSIYESWPLDGLVVTEELKNRIEKGKWKGIYITKLPVVDEPRDGFIIPPDAIYPKRITSYEKRIKDS